MAEQVTRLPPGGAWSLDMVSQWLSRAVAMADDRQTLVDGADILSGFGLERPATLLRTVARLVRGARLPTTGTLRWDRPPIRAAAEQLFGLMQIPADAGPRPAPPSAPADLTGLCVALLEALASPLDEQVERRLSALLPRLRAAVAEKAGDPPEGGTRDPARLADRVAARALRPWLGGVQELAGPPCGSVRLLHATAGHGPLGPYLSGVRRLLTGPRALFGLIHLAAQQGGHAPADEELVARWTLLLSLYHPPGERAALAEEVGDLALIPALRNLAGRERRLPPHERNEATLWHLRDAALDNGEPRLAAHVQQIVARTWPERQIEWLVLGEVEMAAARPAPARAALHRALRIVPDCQNSRARLHALEEGQPERFAAREGYGTPRLRRLIRSMVLETGAAG